MLVANDSVRVRRALARAFTLEGELTEALHALGLAARAVAQPNPPPPAPPRARNQRNRLPRPARGQGPPRLVEDLRIADLAGLSAAPPWHVANIVTAGRLLRPHPPDQQVTRTRPPASCRRLQRASAGGQDLART